MQTIKFVFYYTVPIFWKHDCVTVDLQPTWMIVILHKVMPTTLTFSLLDIYLTYPYLEWWWGNSSQYRVTFIDHFFFEPKVTYHIGLISTNYPTFATGILIISSCNHKIKTELPQQICLFRNHLIKHCVMSVNKT